MIGRIGGFATALVLALTATVAGDAVARNGPLRVAVTTSTANSGLADAIERAAEADLGGDIQFIVAGTGQALRLGANRDVDAVLVHDPPAERDFVGASHGTRRSPVMRNEFLVIGPRDDPADVRAATAAVDALARIGGMGATFVSRGTIRARTASSCRFGTRSGSGTRCGMRRGTASWGAGRARC